MMLNDAGTIGCRLNGKSFPATAPIVAKLGDWVEVHYMNEGQMSTRCTCTAWRSWSSPRTAIPLPAALRRRHDPVGPGERYTVLVHANEPGTWAWHCHILPHAESDHGMFGMVTAMVVQPV